MSWRLRSFAAGLCLAVVSIASPGGRAASLELHENDHIAIIGNTLAERSAVRRLARSQTPRAVSEARPRLPQPRLQRRRGRDAPAVEEFRHARRVAERQAGADWRLPGEPLRRRQHAGRRHLRVLRLQRVLRRRRPGSPRSRQQLGDWIAHTLAQQYNGRSAPRVVLFSPIAHEDLGNPDLPERPREQRPAGALHQGDGRGRRARAT